jgi:hypothetical protein
MTPEDLSLANRLRSSGAVDRDLLARAVASLFSANAGRSLADVLRETGVALPDDIPGGGSFSAAPTRVFSTPGTGRRFGKYHILREIGRGGMGVVYHARESGLDRQVALKALLEGARASAQDVERFAREARAAAALNHPNIVPVFEVGTEHGQHYFTMEFVEGKSLANLIEEEGPMPPRVALRIARDAARALHYAHEKGIIHRDVKPGNILLAELGWSAQRPPEERWRVMLTDFGLAKNLHDGSQLTVSGNMLGTPAYMSPEQAFGDLPHVDAKSDVYSLGAVLYEMLGGRVPFSSKTLAQILADVCTRDPATLRSLRPGLHRDIELIVSKAMDKEKDRRYASAAALADDIDRYLNGEAVLAAPPTWGYRASRWLRRHRFAAAAAAAWLLAGVFASGWAIHRRAEENSRQSRRFDAALSASRAATLEDRFDDAMRQAEIALSLRPADAAAAAALVEAKRRRAAAAIRAELDRENWDAAKAVVKLASEFSADPEVAALARLAEGTCALRVIAEGCEVDLGRTEPGVMWDEESFPAIDEARALGLCAPAGAAPLSRDLPFGETWVVMHRDGKVERLVALSLTRSVSVEVEYRVVRVAATAEAWRAAVGGGMPGHVLELEQGVHEAGDPGLTSGLLVRPAPGAKVTLSRKEGSLLTAFRAHGLVVRDLALTGTEGSAMQANECDRLFLSGLRISSIRNYGIQAGRCVDWTLMDVDVEDTKDSGLFFANSPGGLAVGCDIRRVGWVGILAEDPRQRGSRGARLYDCTVDCAGTLHGIRISGYGSEVAGCAVRNAVQVGIIGIHEGWHGVIRDNVVLDCGETLYHERYGIGIGNQEGHDWDFLHNVVRCSRARAIAPFYPRRVSGNIALGGRIGIQVHSDVGVPDWDYNLVWNCESIAALLTKEAKTLEELHVIAQGTSHPELRPMLHGLVADPKLTEDFRLAPDSPARSAGPGGVDLGVRWSDLERVRTPLPRRLRHENARRYAQIAGEALARGDRAACEGALGAAEGLAPGLPEASEVRSRLK